MEVDVMPITEEEFLPAIIRLTRDVLKAAELMTPAEVRYVVDTYYGLQEFRKRAANQSRAGGESHEPTQLVAWMFAQFHTIEKQIVRVMDAVSDRSIVGRWCKAQYGIGPVLTAGLLAHIDPAKATTAGKIWRFAGLDPTIQWKKGEKRPYNARLKVLAWKIGDSFVKFSNQPKCFYGHLYRQRKAFEVEQNTNGNRKATADATLAARTFKDAGVKAVYESGKLPDGRVDLRARRWAVKIFLAHLQTVMYREHFNAAPPRPYVLDHLGHVDMIQVPGWPWNKPA
jgi:hypothetical protein